MKIVVASDFHADWMTLGISRFDEVRASVEQSVQHAIDTEVDAYLFLGDLTDPDTPDAFRSIAMLGMMVNRLRDAKIPSILLAGNHDVLESGNGDTTLTPLRPFEDEFINVVERPRLVCLDEPSDISFLCLPYTAGSHTYDPAETVREIWPKHGGRVIVLGHLIVPGIIPGEETHEMPRGRDIVFPIEETSRAVLRLNGHFHRRQTSRDGVMIPGSIARFTFGEQDNEPGFLDIEI